jgi:polyisoprenoid-binding protein YceI
MRLSAVFGPALSALVAGVAPGRGEPPRGFSADPAVVRAGTYRLDAAHGKITWTVSHFGMSLYRGQFVDLSGRLILDPERPERAMLRVSVPLDKVGIFHEGLDAHLRNADFFDVPNHPTATFASTRVERTGERQARVTGDPTLRGVTKPVTFVGTFNAAGVHPITKRHTVGFGGEATVKRPDFGMVFAVPAIGDDVRLDLDVEFQLLE